MSPEIWHVQSTRPEIGDTVTVRLVPGTPTSGGSQEDPLGQGRSDGDRTGEDRLSTQPVEFQSPPAFQPGQFTMIYVFGVGEIPVSISGDPSDAGGYAHTVRAVGPVSRAVAQLRAGDVAGVRGPFGTGWPLDALHGSEVVMVAGGLGLAPLRPAIYHLLRRRDDIGRLIILYGARTPEEILFQEELETWALQAGVDVGITVDRADPQWRGDVGVVTRLIGRAGLDPDRTVAFACGPEVMIRFATLELKRHGVPTERIFVSMERNMKCGIGLCGHCQFGPFLLCKDGPVFSYADVRHLMGVREL